MSTAELVRDVEVDVEPDQIAEPYPTDYSAGRAESDLRRIAEARQEIEEIKSHGGKSITSISTPVDPRKKRCA